MEKHLYSSKSVRFSTDLSKWNSDGFAQSIKELVLKKIDRNQALQVSHSNRFSEPRQNHSYVRRETSPKPNWPCKTFDGLVFCLQKLFFPCVGHFSLRVVLVNKYSHRSSRLWDTQFTCAWIKLKCLGKLPAPNTCCLIHETSVISSGFEEPFTSIAVTNCSSPKPQGNGTATWIFFWN